MGPSEGTKHPTGPARDGAYCILRVLGVVEEEMPQKVHEAQRIEIRKKKANIMVQTSQNEFIYKDIFKCHRKLYIIRAI